MTFMQREILPRQAGAQVETSEGTFFVPSSVYYGLLLVAPTGEPPADHLAKLAQYIPYTFGAADVALVTGYFGRMSAPGYLDCTDWEFATSRAELDETLGEMYGDDDDNDQ